MSEEVVYRLAATTAVEPLVNKWVAWSHLIAPVASSLHLAHYQMELLKSYLKEPKLHVDACQNPHLRSGPFVDIPESRAKEVEELLATTQRVQGESLQLGRSLMQFQSLLVKEAKGQSLEPYYERLPPALRGYVELVYDYHHRPAVRFFESLLYHSKFYQRELQSFRLFVQKDDGARPFIMSTPRLPARDAIEWGAPFESDLVDRLFELDTRPRPLGEIRELLGLTEADDERLLPLLTSEPLPPRDVWRGEGARVRYVGHACVLIEWNGVTIMTDPYIGVTPADGGLERISYAELPDRIDYALITHNHHDHFCLETLLRLRHRIGTLVLPRTSATLYGDMSLKLMALALGFENAVELDPMEKIALPDGEIIPVPFLGEHADLAHGKAAYVVRAGREQMMFAADSDCLDPRMYEHVARAIGPIQSVFIGMECVGAPLSWSCGPFLPAKPDFKIEQSRRYKGSDAADVLKVLKAVGAERVFLYAMGREPWLEHLLGLALDESSVQMKEARKLLAAAPAQGYPATLLYGRSDLYFGAAADAAEDVPEEFAFEAALG